MTYRRLTGLVLLLVLAGLSPALHAQEKFLIEGTGTVIRMVQEGISSDVDVQEWLDGGEFRVNDGFGFNPPRVYPGQAPDPYPHVHVWERGIEQLGATAECDGIYFQNGKIWVPNKKIFVVWKIRIPRASQRLAEEFEQDLDVALFVDWNLSGDWERNEQVIGESLNIMHLFPTEAPYIDIEYLTEFRVPNASVFAAQCGGVEFFKEKLWTRAVLSVCDPDASPNGESVYGDVEDYQVCYFEVIPDNKNKNKD